MVQSSGPVESNLWSYFTSIKFVKRFANARSTLKKAIVEAGRRVYSRRSERRMEAAQRKGRLEMKESWNELDLLNNFKLPPFEDKMERVNATTLSIEQFQAKYERLRIPCIINGLTMDSKVHKSCPDRKSKQKHGNSSFKCCDQEDGSPVMPKFKYYAKYMRENNSEGLFYIFDEAFGERELTKELLKDCEEQDRIGENLFRIFGRHEKRPRYRWIVIGLARSGSSIHVDPIGFSSWNSLIHGHRRWVLIHPDTPSELVRIPESRRGLHRKEVITWFLTVYKRIHNGDWPFHKYPVLECRQNPGEIVFVPSGWWHVVINEDDILAVTHNFCSSVKPIDAHPTIHYQQPTVTSASSENLDEKRPELLESVVKPLLDTKPVVDDCISICEEECEEFEYDGRCISTSILDNAEQSDFSESELDGKYPDETLQQDYSYGEEDEYQYEDEDEDGDENTEEDKDEDDVEDAGTDSSFIEDIGTRPRSMTTTCASTDEMKRRAVVSITPHPASVGESEA